MRRPENNRSPASAVCGGVDACHWAWMLAVGAGLKPAPNINPDPYVVRKFFRRISNFLLTPIQGCSIYVLFLLVRGVSGDDPEGGAGSGVPRSWLVTTDSGGAETARRALRPVLQGACCTCSRGNAGAGNADPRPKIAREGAPRGAASRSQGTQGRLASAPVCRVTAHQPVPRKHRAAVGAPPTPHGVGIDKNPGAKCAAGT